MSGVANKKEPIGFSSIGLMLKADKFELKTALSLYLWCLMLGYYEMSKIHGHILTTLFSAIVYNFQKGIEPSISFIALLQRSSKVTLCTTKNEEKQQIHHKIHFS